jgi:predicted ester cyclase
MSVQEQNKAIAQQYIEAINVDDFEKLRELLVPEFIDHTSVGDLPPGMEGVEQAHRMLRTGFPDVRFTIDQLVAEGDKIAMIATGQGTHNGDFIGLAPTGNRVSWIGLRCFRIANGKIAEGWSQFDQLGILQQIGAIPPMGSSQTSQ